MMRLCEVHSTSYMQSEISHPPNFHLTYGVRHIIIINNIMSTFVCRRRCENVSRKSIYMVHKIMCKKLFYISVKTYTILLYVRPRDVFPSDSLE